MKKQILVCFTVIFCIVNLCVARPEFTEHEKCALKLRQFFLKFCNNGDSSSKYKECFESGYEDLESIMNIEEKLPECSYNAKLEFETFKIQQAYIEEQLMQNSYDCKEIQKKLMAVEYCVSYAKITGEFFMRSLDNRKKINEICGSEIIGHNGIRDQIYNLTFQKNIAIIDPSLIMITQDYKKGLEQILDNYINDVQEHCEDF